MREPLGPTHALRLALAAARGKRRSAAFLGFVLQRRGDAVVVRPREENLRRFRARMREVWLLHELGAIDAGEVTSRVRAWLAHARHGHTRALCRRVLRELAFGGREAPEAEEGGEEGEGA